MYADRSSVASVNRPQRFRILIIGRANSGKTTILRAICGTDEEPDVYSRDGRKLGKRSILYPFRSNQASRIDPTTTRGIHDIEESLVFPSNQGFIFHDSPAIEAGTVAELDLIRRFIQRRATEGSIDRQLHAIWYCFPADSNRVLTRAEQKFFQEIDTGKVPVIAIFTKCDALDADACTALVNQGMSLKDAQAEAPEYATREFQRTHLPLIREQRHPPKAVVCMRNMHMKNMPDDIQNATSELIKSTSESLDDGALKVLLAMVQHSNVELCIKTAVERGGIIETAKNLGLRENSYEEFEPNNEFIAKIFRWFPYIWVNAANIFLGVLGHQGNHMFLDHLDPPLQALNYGAAAVIVAANAFQIKLGVVDTECLQLSWANYVGSGKAEQVQAEIDHVFQDLASPTFKGILVEIILRNQITDQAAGGPGFEGTSSVVSMEGGYQYVYGQ
ncbi:hypothetical protein BOTBODRAFT_36846 [Botryobasidium botryosum FD-172 SS1]|uniref:Uncharacterized protein n=1 Tax=Botryobasidium botryosum (strain FD-172 SS1) TaxID=930990 RepID=A0A067M1Y9_BOTB1|nr:hypothetical protein BOTBODRAFT_36846 [Botryobasidium botryosum FD-172 SS1]